MRYVAPCIIATHAAVAMIRNMKFGPYLESVDPNFLTAGPAYQADE